MRRDKSFNMRMREGRGITRREIIKHEDEKTEVDSKEGYIFEDEDERKGRDLG